MNKKSISLILALVLSISCVGTVTVFADPDTSQYEQELETNTNNYKSAQEKVDEIETNIQKITGEMDKINSEIEDLNTQINDTEERLDESTKNVESTKKEIAKEDELFSQRMKAMYMNGMESYINILLESNGLTDFFSRLSNIVTIINYDNDVIATLSDLRASLEEQKAAIENDKANLVALKGEAEDKSAQLDEKKQEQEDALAVAENSRDLYLAAKEETEAQIAEALRQIEEMRTSSNSNSGAEETVNQNEDTNVAAQEQANSSSDANEDVEEPVRPSRGDSAEQPAPTQPVPQPEPTPAPSNPSGSAIVEYAKQFLGCPYQWGGNGPYSFDCSGLTKYVYAAFGIYIPRVAQDQMYAGTPVARSDMQPGDLVFFGTPGNIYHVGIYVGNDCYLHAPQTGDVVKISTLTYRYDFAGARRYF